MRRGKRWGSTKWVVVLLGGVLGTYCGAPIPSGSDDDIIAAAGKGDLARVTLLVQEGADVNTAAMDGATVMHHAALSGNVELVVFLIEHEAKLDAVTDSGDTPLHWAVTGGNVAVVSKFFRIGVDVNARNDDGETPLDLVARGGGDAGPLVDALRGAGAVQGRELDEGVAEVGATVAPARRAPVP